MQTSHPTSFASAALPAIVVRYAPSSVIPSMPPQASFLCAFAMATACSYASFAFA